MPERDATLDAFTSTTDETEERPEQDGATTAPDGDTPAASDESGAPPETATPTGAEQPAERAASTMAWSPDGVACEACGASVERRWRTDSGFVCHSCVDWERTPNQ